MIRCVSDDHPECWKECDGEDCYAYYEEETQECHTSCDPSYLPIEIENLYHRRKLYERLDAKTSLHVRGLLGITVQKICNVYIGIALEQPKHPDSSEIIENAADLIMNIQFGGLVDYRLSQVRWNSASILFSIKVMSAEIPLRQLP